MFDTLVESKSSSQEAARQGSYLGVTAVIYFGLFLAVFVWSLYSMNVEGLLGEGDLASASLVAPVPIPESEPPPPPAPEVKEQKAAPTTEKTNMDTRTALVQDTSESPKEPDKVNNTASNIPPRRPNTPTAIGTTNKDAASTGGNPDAPIGTTGGSRGGLVGNGPPAQPVATPGAPPPPPPPKPTPPPATPTPAPKVPTTISGGVVNGKASSLPKPPYPPAAKAVRASGAVSVQVLIDENGNVVSASAVSGHPLLKAAAVAAARQAKFSPTTLSGQKVKVNGTIVYNFTP